jgi:hypothetical protein
MNGFAEARLLAAPSLKIENKSSVNSRLSRPSLGAISSRSLNNDGCQSGRARNRTGPQASDRARATE